MRKLRANRRNWAAVIAAVLASLLSASCGGSATNPSKTVANVAGLVFNTASLDFGAVTVGGSKKSSITVTNSSPADGGSVSITKIVVTGAGFSLSTPSGGFSLVPGQSATVTVNFAPKVAGDVVGQLSVFIAGSPETGDISLTGATISGNQLVVSPAKLSFGGVSLGSTKTLTGRLSAGSSDVAVSSASWNGQGYSISGITFPVTIPANGSTTYSVTFAPQTAGAVSGGVAFVSNATNSPTTQTFSGTGGAVSQASQHSVALSWNLEGSAISGYNIYRGTQSGGP
jgi:hypothetical protein